MILRAVKCGGLLTGLFAAGVAAAQAPAGHLERGTAAERIARYEDPAREAWQKPDEAVRALGLAPDAVVADLGSGSGYFAVRLARAVPSGKVLALDIEPDFVAHAAARAKSEGLANLEARRVAPDDPGLGEGSIDVILVVNTYHHLPDRGSYWAKLRRALRPGGRVAIVDYTKEAKRGPPPEHRLTRAEVLAEARAAGMVLAREHAFLSEQYFLELTAAAAPRRVLLFVGGPYHDYARLGPAIRALVEADGRFAVEVTDDPARLAPAAVRPYDVLALHTLRWSGAPAPEFKTVPPETREGIAAHVRSGRPLVVLHCAVASFDDWPGFRALTGGIWNWARSKHDPFREMPVRISAPENPLARGVESFALPDELYYGLEIDPGVKVAAVAPSVERATDHPVAWTWEAGGSRVFVTALGHAPESWENPGLRRLVRNGFAWAVGEEPAPPPASPFAFERREAEHELDVTFNGKPLVVYRHGPALRKPYFFPVIGPSGRSVTPENPADHPHHTGFFAAAEADGIGFWQGTSKDRIRHVRFGRTEAEGASAVIGTECAWEECVASATTEEFRTILDDRRTVVFTPLGNGELFVDWAMTLTARKDVEFRKIAHTGFPQTRVTIPMSVKEGGRITNAEGDRDEKGTYGKPSAWLDYSGNNEGTVEGTAVFSHPELSKPYHPPPWFTRDYGPFSPNPWLFAEDPAVRRIPKGGTMSVRWGILIHRGDVISGRVAERYAKYVEKGKLEAGD